MESATKMDGPKLCVNCDGEIDATPAVVKTIACYRKKAVVKGVLCSKCERMEDVEGLPDYKVGLILVADNPHYIEDQMKEIGQLLEANMPQTDAIRECAENIKRWCGEIDRFGQSWKDKPCAKCGSDVGHLINCPDGCATTPDGVIGGPAANREQFVRDHKGQSAAEQDDDYEGLGPERKNPLNPSHEVGAAV